MSPQVRARLERIVAERRGEPAPPGPRFAMPTDDQPEAWAESPEHPAERMDVPGRELRIGPRFERRHLLVIAAVLLVALLVTGGWLIRAREVTSVEVEPLASGSTAPPSPVVPPTPEPEPIRVHVLGAVAAPGVITLPAGARVADAIEAAGGLSDAARPGDLNFAAPVPDGAQIWVGDDTEPGGEVRPAGAAGADDPGATAGGDGLVNLNTATAEQFEALPGVGPVTAGNIVAWRSEHGRFDHVDQLQEVAGIGPKTFQKLASLVTV